MEEIGRGPIRNACHRFCWSSLRFWKVLIGVWHPGAMPPIDNLGKSVSSDSWASVLGRLVGVDQRAMVTAGVSVHPSLLDTMWLSPATQPLEMSLLTSLGRSETKCKLQVSGSFNLVQV